MSTESLLRDALGVGLRMGSLLPGAGIAGRALRAAIAEAARDEGQDQVEATAVRVTTPQEHLASLLEASARLGTRGDDDFLGSLVQGMLPDEARLLAALSGGEEHVALEVVERASRRTPEVVLVRACLAGRAAGVRHPELVPWYLDRLETRGLVVFGGEATGAEARTEYPLLELDPAVLDTLADAGRRRVRARTRRRTVRLSMLGGVFWTTMTASTGIQTEAIEIDQTRRAT